MAGSLWNRFGEHFISFRHLRFVFRWKHGLHIWQNISSDWEGPRHTPRGFLDRSHSPVRLQAEAEVLKLFAPLVKAPALREGAIPRPRSEGPAPAPTSWES